MLEFLFGLLLMGALAGYVGRLLVPGRDPMTFLQSLMLGIVGSFLGGFLGYVVFNVDAGDGYLQPSGIVFSIIGAVIALLIHNFVVARTTMRG